MQAIPAPLGIGRRVPGATAGSILFAGAAGVLAQDNTNFKYSPTGGIGGKPIVQVGSGSTTDLGFQFGTEGAIASGYCAGMWLTNVSPTTANSFLVVGTDALYEVTLRTNLSGGKFYFQNQSTRVATMEAGGLLTLGSAGNTGISEISSGVIGIGSGTAGSFAGSLKLTNTQNVGYWQGDEMTTPAGIANAGRVFFKNNGAGKTQMMVIFPTGAAQQLAIET